MPGVPSNRGCEACRRQKKKCDQMKPSCSRCARLDIPCIGAGQQRYKFKDQSGVFTVIDNQVARRPAPSSILTIGDPSRGLTNKTSIATGTLVSVLEVTDPGYDVFCFGPFIKEIPKRIGHSPALDATAAAFAFAIRGVKTRQRSVESLHKYVSALHAVQRALGDPSTAYSTETLCSVYLIMLCHGWMASKDDKYPHHGEGLAHLLSTMVSRDPKDPFLIQVMNTVAVAVVLEAIFNPAINMHPWIDTLASLSKPTVEEKKAAADKGIAFRCLEIRHLGQMPELMQNPWENIDKIQALYDMVRTDYPGVKQFAETVLEPACVGPPTSLPLKLVRALTRYHAVQCLMLTIAIVLNGFLRTVNPADYMLLEECHAYCEDSIKLAERAKSRRPLAAGHIPMAIIAAWLSSEDATQEAKLAELIVDYEDDYAMVNLVQRANHIKKMLPRGVVSRMYMLPRGTDTGDEACQDVLEDESNPHLQHGANACCIL